MFCGMNARPWPTISCGSLATSLAVALDGAPELMYQIRKTRRRLQGRFPVLFSKEKRDNGLVGLLNIPTVFQLLSRKLLLLMSQPHGPGWGTLRLTTTVAWSENTILFLHALLCM
jgi:hypothetical protein